MPGNRRHCEHTEERYGVSGEDIHRWMDEPVKITLYNHRKFRHGTTQEIPLMFIKKYGEDLARNIMLDHIMLDQETSVDPIAESIEKGHKMARLLGIKQLPLPNPKMEDYEIYLEATKRYNAESAKES